MKHKLQIAIFAVVITMMSLVGWMWALNNDSKGIAITEVRSDYGNVLYYAGGSCHGFVEIYNNSDSDVDLNGWYITDNKHNLYKYMIEECHLKPGEYAVFWSGELTDVPEIIDEGKFLQYSLSPGETIVLSDSEGKIIDKVMIPEYPKGKSYSRDITNNKWYRSEATPGDYNSERDTSGDVKIPTFSIKSGFYENGTKLKIKAGSGCTIYYTNDGSEPTIDSFVYTEPIVLTDNSDNENKWSNTGDVTFSDGLVPDTDIMIEDVYPEEPIPKINVIKAIAVDVSGDISECASVSYIVGYKDKYGFDNESYGYKNPMIMSIITDEDNLFDPEYGIYVKGNIWEEYHNTGGHFPYKAYTNYSVSGKGWRRPAQMELFDEGHNLIESQEIAISIHGGYSVSYNQKSFNLYAQPDKSGNEVLCSSLFSGVQRSLMLRAGGFRDLYSTKIRDVMNMEMMEDTAVLATDYIPCQVFINGEYWGLYNLQERIDETLVQGNYGVNPENVIILKNRVAVSGELGDEQLFFDVKKYAVENDLSNEENYEAICNMIDIDSCIDYYIFQTYVANCDSIANNVSVWRTKNVVDSKYGDGKWRWILYDTDDSSDMVKWYTQAYVDSFSGGHWAKAPMQDELFTALLENEDFKLRFAERFIQMAQTNFSYDNVQQILTEIEQVYVPSAVVSHRRFLNNDYQESDYYAQIQIIKNFFAERYTYIYQHMVTNLGLEAYGY